MGSGRVCTQDLTNLCMFKQTDLLAKQDRAHLCVASQ